MNTMNAPSTKMRLSLFQQLSKISEIIITILMASTAAQPVVRWTLQCSGPRSAPPYWQPMLFVWLYAVILNTCYSCNCP